MSKRTTELPEIMLVIVDTIAENLQEQGVAHTQAISLGMGCADVIMHTFGGEHVYIPKGVHAAYTKRDLEIAEMLKTSSIHEVRKKYGITSRRIYQILQSIRDGEEKPEQLRLFDDAKETL